MLRSCTLALGLALCTVFVACSDDGESVLSTPEELTGAGKGNCPQEIKDLVNVLFSGGVKNSVNQQCNNIERQLGRGKIQDAIAKAFALIGKVLTHDENGQTKEPPGPQTKDEALADLLNALLELVGGSPFFTEEELADPNFGFGICNPSSDCTIVNGTGLAGIRVFAGSTDETKLIKFSQEPLGSQPFPGFQAFDFIYDFEAVGASDLGGGPSSDELALAQEGDDVIYDPPAIVGVCVAEPPHEGAPTGDQLEFLQLARFDEEDEEVELLPIENANFLSNEDCTEASQVALGFPYRTLAALEPISDFLVAPLFASPGRLGGAIAAHSPVGAVDNRGEEDELIPTDTFLEMDDTSLFSGQFGSATATVFEEGFEPPQVTSGDIEFIVDEGGENEQSQVQSMEGSASVVILCDGIPSGSELPVEPGDHTIIARFVGSETHEESTSESIGFTCLAT